VRDLGHAKPTLLMTNQYHVSAGQLIDRYARRMVIENAIAGAINLFHMDALFAAVPMKVDWAAWKLLATGLTIQSALDSSDYPLGVKVSDRQMQNLSMRRDSFYRQMELHPFTQGIMCNLFWREPLPLYSPRQQVIFVHADIRGH